MASSTSNRALAVGPETPPAIGQMFRLSVATAIGMGLLYLVSAGVALDCFFEAMSYGEKEPPLSLVQVLLAAAVLANVGFFGGIVSVLMLFVPRSQVVWYGGLIVAVLAMLPLVTIPFALPILTAWQQPEIRAHVALPPRAQPPSQGQRPPARR